MISSSTMPCSRVERSRWSGYGTLLLNIVLLVQLALSSSEGMQSHGNKRCYSWALGPTV